MRGDSCKEFKVNGSGQLLFIKRKESTTAVSPPGFKKCPVKENTLGGACFNPSSAFLHLQSSQFGSILSSVPVLWSLDCQNSPSSPKGTGRLHPNPSSAASNTTQGTPGCRNPGHLGALELTALQSLSTAKTKLSLYTEFPTGLHF